MFGKNIIYYLDSTKHNIPIFYSQDRMNEYNRLSLFLVLKKYSKSAVNNVTLFIDNLIAVQVKRDFFI